MDKIPFEIVRPKADEAQRARARSTYVAIDSIPTPTHELERTADRYVIDDRFATAINMAIRVQAPLLVTGDPGTGKTQVAYYLKHYLGLRDVFRYQARSHSVAADLKFDFDAVAYLRSCQAGERKDRWNDEFMRKGPLWLAYDSPLPCVLLIDEIDKAPRDFPNDLLQELGELEFAHPFDPKSPKIKPSASRPPIVVATSNAERRLPDAFLRRCIVHHIEVDREFLERVMEAQKSVRFPSLDGDVQDAALEHFLALRALDLKHKPSTAELLTWLAVLSAMKTAVNQLKGKKLRELPALPALIKDSADAKLIASLR